MATTPQQIEPEIQQAPDTGQSEEQHQAPEQDYGDWNETLPKELQNCLVKLARHFCDEFRYARRLEVMQAWRARSFWREMQHLNWNWDGECWDVLGPAGVSSGSSPTKNDSAVLYSTNMYQGFGESFIAIITQSVPSVRFEPQDPEEAADIETAKIGDNFRKYVQHENDPIKLMTKAAYIAWTDGRLHGWTRWEVDKRTQKPREMQSIEGVMEVKVPVIYGDISDYTYLQYSTEYHLSAVRAKVKGRAFPEDNYYKKITGGSAGNGQDVYERTARISIKQGISLKSAGGDMYSHLCTTQRTWMRPDAFLIDDCVEEQYVDQLNTIFPSGCYVEVDNGIYTGSRDACMDNEWAVENIMEGDGSNRNAKGTCLVSVQERANDTINTTQDTFEKMQPATHYDDKVFDTDAFGEQVSAPGQKHPVDMSELPPGDNLSNHVFEERPATVDASQLTYLKSLMSDVPEFLTGISAILFGSDSGGEKSGKALSIQQAAAMGRIGLPFRVLKRFYARMMEQAVKCAAHNRESDINVGVPDEQGKIESISVRLEDLQGNVRCFPDSDENFPESWTSKRQTYLNLMQEGAADPTMHAILSHPKNQVLGKKLIGLSDLEIPDADSWDKQMVEINILLQSPPNPPSTQQVPNPLVPGIMETVPAPPTSTIPVDPDYDNHAAEFETVMGWINSSKGQQMKLSNPTGFMNVRLHGLAHKQELMKQQMAQMQAAAPPQGPSKPKQPTPEGKSHSASQQPGGGDVHPPAPPAASGL